MVKKTLFILSLIVATASHSQIQVNGKSCIGTWETIDDETGRSKSKVKIYKEGNKFYGQIIELLDPKSMEEAGVDRYEDILCDDCPKDRGRDKPVLGLTIVWDMEQEDDRWADGNIMDPKNGKVYGCSMWLDDDDKQGNTLKVRGWLAFFYRTQTWKRVN